MGFCTNCGNELEEHAKFCGKCGTVVEASGTENIEDSHETCKKEKKKRYKYPIVIVAVIVVLLAVGIIVFGQERRYFGGVEKEVNSLQPQKQKVNQHTYYFDANQLYLVDLKDENSSWIGDADAESFLGGDYCEPQFSEGGEKLLCVNGSKLYYYDTALETTVTVSDTEELAWAQISKDGESVVYAIYEDGPACSFFIHDTKTGKTERIYTFSDATLKMCRATDDLEIIAFWDADGTLYQIKNQKVHEIDTGVNDFIELYDSGEMYYLAYDSEKTWLMYSDGEKETVLGESWPRSEMIYRVNHLWTWAQDNPVIAFFNEDEWHLAVKDEVFSFDNASFGYADCIINNSYGIVLSKAGDEVYYLSDDILYHAEITPKGLESIEEYDTEISKCFLYALNDGGIVYIKNDSLYISGECVHEGLISTFIGILEDEITGDIYYVDTSDNLICYDRKNESTVASGVVETMISDSGAILYWQCVEEKEYVRDSIYSVSCFVDGDSTLLNDNVQYPDYLLEVVRARKKRYS